MRRLQLSISEVLALHREGLSNPQIAQRLGCSEATIWRTLREHAGPEEARNGLHGARCRQRLKQWLHQQGYRCLAVCREERYRIKAYLAWPECGPLSQAENRLLAALERL